MRLFLVRDEEDIIESTLVNALELHDIVMVVDDGSGDGTRQKLDRLSKRFPQLIILDRTTQIPDQTGHFAQSPTTTWAMRFLQTHFKPKWIFCLDANEVLPCESRAAFRAYFKEYENSRLIRMPWKTAIPQQTSPPPIR